MRNKKEMLASLILGFLNKAKEVPKTKLAKLILFAEIEHFQRTGDSVTGLYFVRMKMGPVIAFFDEVLKDGEGELWDKKTTPIPIYEERKEKFQYCYAPKREAELSEEVQGTVNIVCKKYGWKTGTELSKLSHDLPAWKYSEPNEPIYVAELACESEEEYFALTDMIEGFEDDEALAEKVSRALSKTEIRI